MPRIKEGFKGERAIVLPDFLIEDLKRDPLGRELHITDITRMQVFIIASEMPKK